MGLGCCKISEQDLASWLDSNPSWKLVDGYLRKGYDFGNYNASAEFVMRIVSLAKSRDHHPEVVFTYDRVVVSWRTVDCSGISQLDLDLAAATDSLFE